MFEMVDTAFNYERKIGRLLIFARFFPREKEVACN